MARKLPAKDVVIIGLGWTGSIMAYELADAGLDVVAIERGPWRNTATDYPPNYAADELRYRIRHELFLRPEQTTFTFRNKMNQTALPIRTWGAFMPPNGVGGGGVHWNAETWRFLPSDFVLRTHLTERYGAGFLPDDMTIQDWGVTYEELEPHYDRFEYLCGTCGQAGNLKGQIIEGGNPFEGPRSRPYPESTAATALRCDAVRQGGARARLQAVSAAVRQHVASLSKSARRSHGTLHLSAASANGSAAAITRKPRRRPRSCRRCYASRIFRRATTARSRGSISTLRASARPASPLSIPAATNGNSPPIS